MDYSTDRLDRLDHLAGRMDSAFRIPGTGIRVGWDSILGLIPGIGDIAALTPAAYIIVESHRMGAPKSVLMRQSVNVAIDSAIGAIPLIGDLFDIGYKANQRNVKILRKHLDTEQKKPSPTREL